MFVLGPDVLQIYTTLSDELVLECPLLALNGKSLQVHRLSVAGGLTAMAATGR